ncbi:hypothetical protein M231_00483 [Tremella mesenterica]|uniref:Gfd2/YDR514C-like C-terminal domain-containing protein n=1 Tax=Tremella mesenterica TaxID=5217 RepID=A0A4Q1BVR1_TREME|nr:hypothetical protein M231_00483 [Tremella mesenterica]
MAESGQESNSDKKQGLEHVKDGFYRYPDILFAWHKALNPWHANAVKALVNNVALVHTDHPLRLPDNKGIGLSFGTEKDGKRRLYFSQAQIEYLQYYIHETCLTKPDKLLQVLKDQASQRETAVPGTPTSQTSSTMEVEHPTLSSKRLHNIDLTDVGIVSEWVPLPDCLCLSEDVTDVQEVVFDDAAVLKKQTNLLSKLNRHIKRERYINDLPTEVDKSLARIKFDQEIERSNQANLEVQERIRLAKEVASEDNNTPGPGLWRGPRRERTQRSRPEDDKVLLEQMQAEEVDQGKVTEETAQAYAEQVLGVLQEQKSSISSSVDTSEDDNFPRQNLPPVVPDSTPEFVFEMTESPPVHYHHAQQAFILASHGGLAAIIANPEIPSSRDGSNSETSTPVEVTTPSEVGRSLFVALDLIKWEEDDKTVLEVGYSASWWQENLEGTATDANAKFEESRESGHFIVQDHRLTKKNQGWLSDYRDKFAFGHSLPVAEKDLAITINQKIIDLSQKAGRGHTYVLVNSSESDPMDLASLGLSVNKWWQSFKPRGNFYPSYMSPEGSDKTSFIDLAVLFAMLEWDQSAEADSATKWKGPMKTEKSLEEMVDGVFGIDEDRYLGNAGNDSVYKLETFLALITTTDLSPLRQQVQQASKAFKSEEEKFRLLQAAAQGLVELVPTSPHLNDQLSSEPTEEESVPDGEVQGWNQDVEKGEEENHLEDSKDEHVDRMSEFEDEKVKNGLAEEMQEKQGTTNVARNDNNTKYNPQEDEDSDDDNIKGVYFNDDDGEIVECAWE